MKSIEVHSQLSLLWSEICEIMFDVVHKSFLISLTNLFWSWKRIWGVGGKYNIFRKNPCSANRSSLWDYFFHCNQYRNKIILSTMADISEPGERHHPCKGCLADFPAINLWDAPHYQSGSFFIGPESDHWQCLSLTVWLTDWLTHSVTFSKLGWCDPGVWRCLLKTC